VKLFVVELCVVSKIKKNVEFVKLDLIMFEFESADFFTPRGKVNRLGYSLFTPFFNLTRLWAMHGLTSWRVML
jgi:hypothetical protein